jgi:hypothetical protein
MQPELIFCDDNENTVGLLRQAFEGCSCLIALFMRPDELLKYEVDAVFLTLVAAERWGSQPLPYQSQVLKTQAQDRNMPPYVVTGIAMEADDLRIGNPEAELELVLKAVLEAVESFNKGSDKPIRVIGFSADMLQLKRIEPTTVGRIIRSIVECERNLS